MKKSARRTVPNAAMRQFSEAADSISGTHKQNTLLTKMDIEDNGSSLGVSKGACDGKMCGISKEVTS